MESEEHYTECENSRNGRETKKIEVKNRTKEEKEEGREEEKIEGREYYAMRILCYKNIIL